MIAVSWLLSLPQEQSGKQTVGSKIIDYVTEFPTGGLTVRNKVIHFISTWKNCSK